MLKLKWLLLNCLHEDTHIRHERFIVYKKIAEKGLYLLYFSGLDNINLNFLIILKIIKNTFKRES